MYIIPFDIVGNDEGIFDGLDDGLLDGLLDGEVEGEAEGVKLVGNEEGVLEGYEVAVAVCMLVGAKVRPNLIVYQIILV